MSKFVSIAIDGPAGAGKSTMAKAVAKDLGFIYVDTGAIYRTIGYHVALCGIGPKDVDGVSRLIDDVNIEIAYGDDGSQRMILNGKDVTGELRTPKMSDYASKISAMKVGRDIGTVVLPQADVKIFLTASAEVRAKRRLDELVAKGDKKATFEQVLADMKERDYRDMNRDVAPLKQAEDAVLLDTSDLTIEQSVAAIKGIVEKRMSAC